VTRSLRNRFHLKFVSLFLTFVLVASSVDARSAPDSFADLAAKLLPAVVNISTTALAKQNTGKAPELPQFPPGSPFEDFFRDFFDRNSPQQQRKSTSLGSGFIIDKTGIVITNNHVIQDADEITVILQNNETLKAEVVGRDLKTDIAVLRVKPKKDLPFVKLGDSDKMRVGDWVVAIGNPFGLGGSVTAGIVSARGRNINSGPYDDFIQTDASINRGNSGGPLFNMAGEVIGINTAIFSPSGGSIGIGFSIPSRIANGVINQLIKFGKTRRGWLGVRIQKVTDEIAESLGLKTSEGALVASVTENSPAAKGDIKAGDVILKFNNKPVKEMRNLPKIVAETDIDKKVDVEIWRDGKKVITQVSVGELDEEQVAKKSDAPGEKGKKEQELKIDSLGLSVGSLTDGTRKRFNLKGKTKGVVIVAVEKDGAAAEKNIKAGDVIVEVSQNEVNAPSEVKKRIDAAKESGRKSVLLLIEGQAGLRFVALRLTKK
jgi:serine protease Do